MTVHSLPATASAVVLPPLEDRAEAGAAFLDEKRPGWAHKIHLYMFDMGDTCNCVLGQIWAPINYGYYSAVKDLHLSDSDALALGFTLPRWSERTHGEDWPDLERLWIDLIRTRQAVSQ